MTRRDRRRLRTIAGAALGCVVVFVAFATCGGSPHGPTIEVTVPQGASLTTAVDSLARAEIITSPRLFRLYALVRRDDRSIQAGTYAFRRGMSWGEVLDALRGGKGVVATLTIPEGFALRQIVPLLASRLDQPLDSVWAAVSDTDMLRELDIPTPTLEGYLFPDTYTFLPRTSARTAVRAMVDRFEQAWKPAWTARLDSIPFSRHDIITLASIVEKEARLPEERPVIAAVYVNRLRDGMLLQADPTVQYSLGEHQQRVLYKHLEVESPYNTYRHRGLPPGPIASPGAPSIAAALYPANVPYEFFVALPDGHHEFRTDYAAHQRARRTARAAWDSLSRVRDSVARAARQRSKPAARTKAPAP